MFRTASGAEYSGPGCACASMNPGTTVLPARSNTRVFASIKGCTDSLLPTARNLPSAAANACARGWSHVTTSQENLLLSRDRRHQNHVTESFRGLHDCSGPTHIAGQHQRVN